MLCIFERLVKLTWSYHKLQEVSGVPDYGLIPTQSIKVEVEEESDLFGGSMQPLPPGEDL